MADEANDIIQRYLRRMETKLDRLLSDLRGIMADQPTLQTILEKLDEISETQAEHTQQLQLLRGQGTAMHEQIQLVLMLMDTHQRMFDELAGLLRSWRRRTDEAPTS